MFEMSNADLEDTLATEGATGGVRIRQPNVTIDQSAVANETIFRLKASRSAAKGVITRKQNEAREIMSDFGEVSDLERKRAELDEAIDKFKVAHQAYHEQLVDQNEIDDSLEYYDTAILLANDTRRIIDDWIQGFSQPSRATDLPEINPDDSISCVDSRVSPKVAGLSQKSRASSRSGSRSSRRSSVSSARIAVAAKRASLTAEASMLRKQQALQQEELRLQQRKQELALETEIAKAEAEERVLAQAEVGVPELVANVRFRNTAPAVKSEFRVTKEESNVSQQLLKEQQLHTLTLTLPQPEVPTFTGDPIEYCSFIRAFKSMIEAKTASPSSRLYYLVQYTAGDVQELMRSCLAMDSDRGYQEARKLLAKRYGQPYKIASAYVDRVTNGSAIKAEDGTALQSFSVLLTSCKNTLNDIGYLSKIENPDSLRKVVTRLPFNLRQKWRDVADDITERKAREVTFADVASFVEMKARVLTHPIFGDISSEPKSRSVLEGRKPMNRGASSFGADAHDHDPNSNTHPINEGVANDVLESRSSNPSQNCPLCRAPHWLSQCKEFRSRSVRDRYELVREKELCYNCLIPGHYASTCPKSSFCKVDGCSDKH